MNFDKGSVSGHPLRGPILALLFVLLLPCIVSAAEVPPSGNIDPNNDGSAFAWGENIGWINLKPTAGPGVTVTDTAVTGMAWGENIGWINLSPTDGGVINDGAGHLSGFAWGENIGWINFAPTGGGGVTITGATGIFTGFAWGENIGWINFAPTGGGGVMTSWRAPATVQKLTVTPGGTGMGAVTSNPAGIACGGVCSHYFQAGNSVTLTATVGADSFFAGWGGACTGTSLTCAVTLNADKAVTATFTHDPVTLTVNRTGVEAGSVASTSPSGAITCGSTCSATLAYGTPVALTATLSPGGSLVGWTGCDSANVLTCTVTMNNPRTVTATFAFPLSVIEAGNGSGTVTSNTGGINCTGGSGACSVLPPTGSNITLTATPAIGSIFVGWLGEGCNGTGTCPVVLNEARSVTAIFNFIPLPPSYTLTVSKVGNGLGTVASTNPSTAINCGATCNAPFEQFATVTLTATADGASNSTFAGWSGPCTGTETCFVTMTGARTVTATFEYQPPGTGPAYEVIHHFVGSPSVVAHRLLEGGDGFLYGSGKQGGTNGSGIIFKMRPNGSDFEILREYPSWNEYKYATTDPSELVLGSDGVLYGVTEWGGTGLDYSGPGTIFKINRDGTGYAVLHSFNGTTEGSRPLAALIQASNGSLYGSTSAGPNGNSVLFSLVSGTGQFSIIHSFANADGQTVYGALREGIDHKLYGMAAGGGAIGYGTIFRLNLDGSGFEVIHSFDSVVGGGASYGPLVQGADATLYGATISGGANGAIFKLQPDGSAFTVLHLVNGYTEGSLLWSGVVLSGDGTLYGAAQQTAYLEKRGTVFALKTDGSRFTTLHTFVDEAEGWWPFSGLLLRSDGSVFGSTSQGGTGTTGDGTASHGGVAFKLSPPFTLNYDLHVSVASAWNGHVISAPGAIDCYTECSAYFAPGSTVILTAIPFNGYVFTGWSGDCTGTEVCTLTMGALKNVTATFDQASPPTTHAVTVSKIGTGSGTVTSNPAGIACGATCSGAFAISSSMTLTAAAATGSVFTGWTGPCTGTAPSCTFTVDAAKWVQAEFTSVGTSSITVGKVGTGTVSSSPAGITCGGTCNATFTFGTSVTLTATAAAGFSFAGWSGEGCSGTGGCSVSATLTRNVTANFTDIAAPVISHTPVTNWTANKSIPITATITDTVGVQGATLYYRPSFASSYGSVAMTAAGTTYSGTIPGGPAMNSGVQYYLEARDAANNVVRSPSTAPATPYSVVVGPTVFTDDPLAAATTPIKAIHFIELRTAIYALWSKYSVPGVFPNWTGTAPAPGGPVQGSHLADLRTALDAANFKAKNTHLTFDSIQVGTTLIKASHLNELRTYVHALE